MHFLKYSSFLLLFLLAQGLWAQKDSTRLEVDSTLYAGRAHILVDEDTVFTLYSSINGYSATDRASLANRHLDEIMSAAEFYPDSFSVQLVNENVVQINYRGGLVHYITSEDAAWYEEQNLVRLAENYRQELSLKCNAYVTGVDLKNLLIQIGLALLVIFVSGFVIRYVNRLFKFLAVRVERLKGVYLKGISFRNYEFITEERLTQVVLVVLNILRIFFLLFLLYLTLPILFSIFPWTEGLANTLINYIVSPITKVIRAIIGYIPNLFTILVIYFVIHYLTKGVRFLAREIQEGKLHLNNFYPDWAVPTARIVNFLLYAFMLVLIWPYLPGSDSAVFKGVSVFLGLLISLGSSSAISNIVAGLVITYMRPYKLGDRVKIAETYGDIIEKNLLVTRVKTIKNEIITVPNSQVLASASINFSQSSDRSDGLVVHSTVTIGYDVPWRKVHKMLIEAACQTPFIEEIPKPFVLQTSLDDFYVSYQINAYTNAPERQAKIYSDLHALIQDIFARNGVEIMSPHYRAHRDGPDTTPTETNGK